MLQKNFLFILSTADYVTAIRTEDTKMTASNELSKASVLRRRLLSALCLVAALAVVGVAIHPKAATADEIKTVIVTPQPLPVIDQTPDQPVQVSITGKILNNTAGVVPAPAYTVPAGKRLVIEFVSSGFFNTLAGVMENLGIITTVGGQQVRYFVSPPAPALPPVGSAGVQLFFGQAVKIYADPQTVVYFEPTRNSATGDTNYFAAFSGHLANVP